MSILDDLASQREADPRRAPFDYTAFIGRNGPWRDHERLLLSNRSVYDFTANRKLLDSHLWPLAPWEIAGPYLQAVHRAGRPLKGMGRYRVPWRQESLRWLKMPAPNYFRKVVHHANLAYVDVDAAFYSLYHNTTLDMGFEPGRYSYTGRLPWLEPSALADDKLIRNALIGIVRSTSRTEARYGEVITLPTVVGNKDLGVKANNMLAPGLWAYITHCLHHVAADAVKDFGAVMWATDGGIFPREKGERFVTYLAETWGLTGSLRAAGPGVVRSVASWQIGATSKGRPETRGQTIAGIAPLEPEVRAHVRRVRHQLLTSPL